MNVSTVYRAVRTALKRGSLSRAEACQRCGRVPPPCSDGRAAIQAHHHDYTKPLDVEWVCAKCHRKETPLPKTPGGKSHGEKNGQAKLTESGVIAARRLRSEGISYSKIALHLNVSKRTAMRAVKGELWKHIPLAAPAASKGEKENHNEA